MGRDQTPFDDDPNVRSEISGSGSVYPIAQRLDNDVGQGLKLCVLWHRRVIRKLECV